MGFAVGMTATLLGSWASGKEPTWADALNTAGGLISATIGIANPVLGMVATVAFGFLGGLLGGGQDNQMEEFYKQIMKEVKGMITKSQMITEVGNRITDLQSLVEELNWVPAMLGGIKDEGNAHELTSQEQNMLLMYDIMLQHDIAKTSYRIRTSKFGKTEEKDSAVSDAWSLAMLPIALQVQMLQVNLILDIASYEEEYKTAIIARLKDLLVDSENSFKKWFESNTGKALKASRSNVKTSLGWKIEETRSYSSCTEKAQGKCPHGEMDACSKIPCKTDVSRSCELQGRRRRRRRSEYQACSAKCSDGALEGACSASDMDRFFNREVEPVHEGMKAKALAMADACLGKLDRTDWVNWSPPRHKPTPVPTPVPPRRRAPGRRRFWTRRRRGVNELSDLSEDGI